MKKYLYLFISIFIISSLDGMKRDVDHVYEDLEDGLNPGEDVVSRQGKFVQPPFFNNEHTLSLINNFSSQEIKEIKPNNKELPVYKAFCVQETVNLLPATSSNNKDDNDNDQKQFLSISDIKTNNDPSLSYSRRYTKNLFLKEVIYDNYHSIPQWLVWCMIKSLKGKHHLSVFSKGSEGSNFSIKVCHKRIMPVLFVKSEKNNNVNLYRYTHYTKAIKVITDSVDNSIKHINFEKEYFFNSHDDLFLKNILCCANQYAAYLSAIVENCHNNYLAVSALSRQKRYEKVKEILNDHKDESVVNIKVEDANALGDFFDNVVVCDYPFEVQNQEKILYFPLNRIFPTGIFTASSWISADYLAAVKRIKY